MTTKLAALAIVNCVHSKCQSVFAHPMITLCKFHLNSLNGSWDHLLTVLTVTVD